MVASRGCSKALLRTLHLDPGVGGELEAYGELIPRAALDIPVSNIPRIFGLTSEGQRISLWDCHGAGCSYTMLRCTKQSFVILKAVVGLHCSETELKFTRTSLEYEHLGTWLRGFSGIQMLIGQGMEISGETNLPPSSSPKSGAIGNLFSHLP